MEISLDDASALGSAAPPPQLAATMMRPPANAFAEADPAAAARAAYDDVAAADACGCTALHHAAADRGTAEVLDALLDGGAPIDATDQHGNSALHGAGRFGRAAAFEHLVRRGADAQLQNGRGRPPKLLEGGGEACAVM